MVQSEGKVIYYFIEPIAGQPNAFYFDDDRWITRHGDAFYFGGDAVEKLISPDAYFTKLKYIVDTDYLTYGSLTIVSESLASFLNNRVKAKFIPMNGFYKGKPYTEKQFYIVCLLEHIEPLDLEKSIYNLFTNESTGKTFVVDLDKIVLSPEKTANSPAFKMSPLGFYLYREDICKAILAAGFKGMRFIPIERYRQNKIEDLSPFELVV